MADSLDKIYLKKKFRSTQNNPLTHEQVEGLYIYPRANFGTTIRGVSTTCLFKHVTENIAFVNFMRYQISFYKGNMSHIRRLRKLKNTNISFLKPRIQKIVLEYIL